MENELAESSYRLWLSRGAFCSAPAVRSLHQKAFFIEVRVNIFHRTESMRQLRDYTRFSCFDALIQYIRERHRHQKLRLSHNDHNLKIIYTARYDIP
jgi:hypothetical protein